MPARLEGINNARMRHASKVQCPHEACFQAAFAQLKSSNEISTSTDCHCRPRKKKIFFHTTTSFMAASSPSDPCWIYDVFLSFRGEDVRYNFLGHLYSALIQAGLRTYKDDNELTRGSDIAPNLLEAIEHSRIAIVVFSKNYVDSGWCLDELVEILSCREKLGQIVLPIFFHVDPSDVRKQSESFGQAFACAYHQKVTVDKVERWKTALTTAANLAGFHLQSVNGDESKLIKKIVEDVWEKVHPTYPSDVDDLFGIDSPVERIISLLRLDSEDVRFIGIYGMPGIGKTTVAKVIRNRISKKFDGNSLLMLEDIQLGSKHGLVELQKRLLYDILRVRDLHLSNIDNGIDKIRCRLQYKKVLIILDNVDHLDQLAALAKERSWFGIGSRIIVTCRDEQLLNAHRVDATYEVPGLPLFYAKQLFSWHASRKCYARDDYADISREIVTYAGGHPLALKVLGSFLSGRTLPEWTSALEELKSTSQGEIFERLKIGFDSLNVHQQNIFLDIAFFLVGMDEDDAIRILDGCGFYAKIQLCILIQKCLLTITEKKLRMHSLLQEMAREIVRRENPGEPGERSRLSFYKDVRKVLKYHEGTDKVTGLTGFFPKPRDKPFSAEALAGMKKVRILQLRNADIDGGWGDSSKELRWLCWEGCRWLSIPASLNLKKLVVLRLCCSKLQYIWEQSKVLKNLKVLDLSHSHDLIRTSDISGLFNIEKLIFRGCINLIEVHQSIGNLSKLIYLDLENCQNLVHLPSQICKLRFLENLDLYCCSKLRELPEDFGNMESLKELNIGCTAIKNVPVSTRHLKNLTKFFWNNKRSLLASPGIYDLESPNLSPLCSLTFVKVLSLSFCNLSDNSFPRDLGGLRNLETLLLRGNAFYRLPTFLSDLPKLTELDVSECDLSGTSGPMVVASPSLQILDLSKNNFCSLPVDLTSLPNVAILLEGCKKVQQIECGSHTKLYAAHCTLLEKVTFKGRSKLSRLGHGDCSNAFVGCEKLVEIQGQFKLKPLTSDQLAKLEHLFGLKALQSKRLHIYNHIRKTCSVDCPIQVFSDFLEQVYSIFLHGGVIPNWFNHENNGASIVVNVSQDSSGLFEGLAVCVVYSGHSHYGDLSITLEDIGGQYCYYKYHSQYAGCHDTDEVMWVSFWRVPSLVGKYNRFRVTARDFDHPAPIFKRIGFRFLSEEELDLASELSSQPLEPIRLQENFDFVLYNSRLLTEIWLKRVELGNIKRRR